MKKPRRAGVRVRAAGVTATTGPRGRAGLRVRYLATGRRRVTARKVGCRTATAIVRVRRAR